MDRRVEIGVVVDDERQQHLRFLARHEMPRRAMAVRRPFRQQLLHARPQRAQRLAPARCEVVQVRLRARLVVHEVVGEAAGEIEDPIADRHADVRVPARAEDAERQVLERKIARVIRRLHPRFQSHPSSFKSAIGSSKEQEPKEIANSLLMRIRSSVATACPLHEAASSPNSNARASVSVRIVSACCSSAAAMKTLTNPCIVPVGASGSYVSGFTQRIGWCKPAVALNATPFSAHLRMKLATETASGNASGVIPPVRIFARSPRTASVSTSLVST